MMKPVDTMRISDKGVDVLVDREGLRTQAYQDSVGVWTIGIGHTSAAGPPRVQKGLTLTEDQCWDVFWKDTETFRKEAKGLVTAPLEQHQYDALASFIFNIGVGGFRTSTVRRRLNGLDYDAAGEAILLWNKPPEIMPRRRGEYQQFMKGEYVARA